MPSHSPTGILRSTARRPWHLLRISV
jgi:hypothetical protein